MGTLKVKLHFLTAGDKSKHVLGLLVSLASRLHYTPTRACIYLFKDTARWNNNDEKMSPKCHQDEPAPDDTVWGDERDRPHKKTLTFR